MRGRPGPKRGAGGPEKAARARGFETGRRAQGCAAGAFFWEGFSESGRLSSAFVLMSWSLCTPAREKSPM